MSVLVEAAVIVSAYVAGCVTGHTVVTYVKAKVTKLLQPLHNKLDALLSRPLTGQNDVTVYQKRKE
jgi:outer membrane murein-binding lipoprotein Lpp